MAAISIVQFDNGIQTIFRGTLLDCPVEFFSHSQMSFYLNSKIGWNICPLGYWCYSELDSLNRKLVIPGINLTDEVKRKKRFKDFGVNFSRSQIEKFISTHVNISQIIRETRDTEFKNLTHDLRAMGAEIYNTALRARNQAEYRDEQLLDPLDDVLAAQQMLSVRLDIVDYESGYASSRPSQNIPVFRKIDKVLRCFRSRLKKHRIELKIEGGSYAEIYGPPIFELIPFVLIENAIKYAPVKSQLAVRYENKDEEIIIRFESLGPKIKQSEKQKIFHQNFRGEAAETRQSGGSGIGLYGAKTLVESHYGGKIFVNQDDQLNIISGVNFFETRFTLIFPIA